MGLVGIERQGLGAKRREKAPVELSGRRLARKAAEPPAGFPPGPLDREVQNGYPTAHFAAFKNQFAIIFDVNWSYEPPKRNELSFGSIRDWIYDTYGFEI